jgi:hypothetical protein
VSYVALARARSTDLYSRESRHGRLRGRSASPDLDHEGDGRYGFPENGTATRTRYRSRSRSPVARHRRQPSNERWAHDRAGFGDHGPAYPEPRYPDAFSSMGNHRRSDAFDETAKSGTRSLLDRMTKDDVPMAPQGRSLASRITRDDDDDDGGVESSYGRLRDDYSAPRDGQFSGSTRGLAGRITRVTDTGGINIRGSASQRGGFSIRGVANGA